MPEVVDLRSDTVTRPCSSMRAEMARATVGDDVIGDDPTVAALQTEIAELLGKEAGLFVPSGSMANQIALRVHCHPGDEFVCEAGCHIYNYEQGGFAQLSGLVSRVIQGNAQGIIAPEKFQGLVRAEDDHAARTRMVTLENTHNRGGGSVQPIEIVEQTGHWARENQLRSHLDGARLFNAVAATGIEPAVWAGHFDSVGVCFSKGLGAPVGSALVGSRQFIREARRARKMLGGGMRQAGIIAAGALFALRHNRDRLKLDHVHAQRLAESVCGCPGLSMVAKPQSNIVLIEVAPSLGGADQFVAALAERNVLCFPFGPTHVRLVTHLDVSSEQIELACQAIEAVAGRDVSTIS